ncbi:TPA: hypothetical protein L7V47_004024 [Klebsiella pneumoniae]|nr:hypothetical protein [Klebsiella pneumoniae]
MNHYNVESVLKNIISDEAASDLIDSMNNDDIYLIHEELNSMKDALSLATSMIIDRMTSHSVNQFEEICSLGELNNLQKILNNIDIFIAWCHTGGKREKK